ncbi:NB-ARC domain-containing protein [Streptomyces sp. NPDC096057]|uniref:NB-ARC domain-containing protein n=1 Tax=Streptomyces sp. NPDC096057 TaxID=3155543 RepID=UPI00332208E5
MIQWGRRLGQVAVALCVAAGSWLCVVAVRGGWDAANPVASVLGGGAGILALLVSMGFGPGAGGLTGDPPPPPSPVIPSWVVDRDEVEQLVAAVCEQTRTPGVFRRSRTRRAYSNAVGITTALHGAGGFGKTTLAHMVCAHPRVRRVFHGRVYVVTVGRDVRSRAAIAAKVAEATRFITGDTLESGDDPGRAGDHLGRLLARRPRTLLVIDDVWEAEHLEPFLRGAQEQCVRLVTTRKPNVLPPDAIRTVVDRMSSAQAGAVLAYRLAPGLPSPLANDLIKATGRWPLLLRLVNQLIAVQAATGVQTETAAQAILDRLRADGPAAADPDLPLDLDDPVRRNTAVRASIQAATELLPRGGGRRFAELGIFAEDEAIPIPLVASLWGTTGNLGEPEARSLCMQMASLSLLSVDASVSGGAVALHDVVHDYLRAQIMADLPEVNGALVESVAAVLPRADGVVDRVAWWQMTEGYLQDHLIEHLLDAGRAAEAEGVAGDLRWVRTRLLQRGPTAPWRDLDRIDSPTARALAADVARAAHLLSPTEPPHALDAVLRSRLSALTEWTDQPYTTVHPHLSNRWPPPDLPTRSLLRTITGSAGSVRALAFNEAGTMLASVGDDQCVRLWNPATGAAVRTLTGHQDRIRAVAFSPDNALLATADEDGHVWVWDPATGAALHTLAGHEGHVNAVVFSPDGTELATAAADGRVWGWDPATGAPRRRLTGPVDGIRAMAFSPDGSLLATADTGGWIRIWDTVNATMARSVADRVSGSRALSFSPDGTILATAGEDRRVHLWDPLSGAPLRTLVGHEGYVNAVTFSPDGTELATAGYDRAVRLWNPATGAALRTLSGHEGHVNAVAFSADGSLFAVAGHDRAVRLQDPAARVHNDEATGVREIALAVGNRVVTADDDGKVRLWNPSGGTVLRTLTDYVRGVRTVALSPDGSLLATVGEDGQLWVWDPDAGIPARAFGNESVRNVRAATFRPNGSMLATADTDGTVRLWECATGTVESTLTDNLHGVRALAFGADNTTLAVLDTRGAVQLWDIRAGNVPRHLTQDSAQNVLAMTFDATGSTLATAGDNGVVHLWNTITGTIQRTLGGQERHITALAFSGPRLATVSDDGSVRIWDAVTGEVVTLIRTDSPLRCCSWDPDGRTLFVGGRGGLFGFNYHPGARTL